MKKAILTALLIWFIGTTVLYISVALVAGWNSHEWGIAAILVYSFVQCIIWAGGLAIADAKYKEV